MAAPPEPTPGFVLWGVLALVQCVLCGALLTGVPGAILAFMGKGEWEQGRYDSAKSKLKIAKILTIIGFVLMGLVVLLYVAIIALGAGMGAFAPTGTSY